MILIFLARGLMSSICFPFQAFLLQILLKVDMEARPLFRSFSTSSQYRTKRLTQSLLSQHVG